MFLFNVKSNAVKKMDCKLENETGDDGPPKTTFSSDQAWFQDNENRIVFLQSDEDDRLMMSKYAVIKDKGGAKQPYFGWVISRNVTDFSFKGVTNFLAP